MARNPVVYILASHHRRALYIGVTTELSRRLEEHRQGMVHHTARYNIPRLIYFESHETAVARWRGLVPPTPRDSPD